jgi:hypothetical protein
MGICHVASTSTDLQFNVMHDYPAFSSIVSLTYSFQEKPPMRIASNIHRNDHMTTFPIMMLICRRMQIQMLVKIQEWPGPTKISP